MQFSKLAMTAAASVGSLASAQLIPFDITGAGGDSFDYPFSATGVPNTITVDAFFVNGGAGTQAGDLQLILTSPSGTCLELGGRDLGFGCPTAATSQVHGTQLLPINTSTLLMSTDHLVSKMANTS